MERKKTELLSDVLLQVLDQQHLTGPLTERRLLDLYPSVVGEFINSYTTQRSFRNGVLYISISSAPLRQELLMSREALMVRLNNALGVSLVNSIVIR